MIDTITLSLPKGAYKILSPDDFKPSFEPINYLDNEQVSEFHRVNKGGKEYNHLLDLSSRQRGKVYPNLTIFEFYKRRKEEYFCELKITFSCPKLLWGQSFNEVKNKDFPKIINILTSRLKDIAVIVSPSTLQTATVTRVDYCRNTKYSSMAHARAFLDRLRKCSFPKMETDLTRYANNGRAVRFHSDLFETIFYLKYYDLLEPLKRSVDRRRTPGEIAKAKQLQKKKVIPPVIRMETRFIGRTSVNSHLDSALGITKGNWTFQEIFKEVYSKRTRKYYWDKITSDPRNYLILTHPSDEDVCRKVLEEFKTQRPKGIFEGLGLFYVLKTLGVTEMKTIFTEQWDESTWFAKRNIIAEFAANYSKPETAYIDQI
jgi:hypothetical protein